MSQYYCPIIIVLAIKINEDSGKIHCISFDPSCECDPRMSPVKMYLGKVGCSVVSTTNFFARKCLLTNARANLALVHFILGTSRCTMSVDGNTKPCLPSNEEICSYYFKLVESKEGNEKYECKLCMPICRRTKKKGSGLSNLMSHVKLAHPTYLEDVLSKRPLMDQYLVTKKVSNIFGWIDWIVTDGLPFSHCEKPCSIKYSNLDPISVDTLMKYLNLLTRAVEKVVRVCNRVWVH